MENWCFGAPKNLGVYIEEIRQSKNEIRIHKILDHIIMRSA
jgi:hypothetical protein